MTLGLAIGFLVIGSALVLMCAIAIVRLGLMRLESPLGVHRDGLPDEARAPAWSLPDHAGEFQQVPSKRWWQLLLFADYSLVEFPKLAVGIRRLMTQDPTLQVLILCRTDLELTTRTAQILRLFVPVIKVEDTACTGSTTSGGGVPRPV